MKKEHTLIMSEDEKKALYKNIIVKFSLFPVFIAICTIVPAGTFNYWYAYLYFSVLFIPMIFVIIYFFKNDPEFLKRRLKSKEKEKQQKLVIAIFTPVLLAGFFIPGLDYRFGWSEIPVFIVIAANLVVFLGYLFIIIVFRQNSYASRIIEIDKNQKLITNGLYSIIRHPMYLGVLIMYLPTPIALGSYWGNEFLLHVFLLFLFYELLMKKKSCQKTFRIIRNTAKKQNIEWFLMFGK